MGSSFYGQGPGSRLVDPVLLPHKIHDFLNGESLLLESFCPDFSQLVEVGCMNGRYLNWAVDHGKSYLGIDLVETYTQQGSQRAAEMGLDPIRFCFHLGDAEKLDQATQGLLFGTPLALFPFNSFGNIERPDETIRSLSKSNIKLFLISTYDTSDQANEARLKYYRACGLQGLTMKLEVNGCRFTSKEGLSSMAYHPNYVHGLLSDNGIAYTAYRFAGIGIAYTHAT